MTVTRVLASATVSDLDRALEWYSTVLGREPDAHPMEGLAEFHLAETFGVQVWAEPDRAGHSSLVLDEDDLDGLVDRLDAAGVENDGPQDVTASRALMLTDPDGNRVVFTGPFRSAP